MTPSDLAAIRARDAKSYDDDNWLHVDRRALLAYVDALRAAAGKVTCRRCLGHGDLLQPDAVPPGWRTDPCPDCTDLRTLLNEVKP